MLNKQKDNNFDSTISECIDRALSILGDSLKEFVVLKLEKDYHLALDNLGKDPAKLEEGLRETLGDFVAASVLNYIANNISEAFKMNFDGCTNLTRIVEHVRNTA